MLKRLFGALLIIGAVFYFVQPPTVENMGAEHYSAKEQKIEAREEKMTIGDRVSRMTHFEADVQEAVNERVKPGDFIQGNQIPKVLKQALVATEDKRYYEHGGIDFYGVARALYINTVAGQTVEGGSTITQQVVKNLFLTSKRVWSRKIEEAVWAVLMEHYYTKDQILTIYLNTIYYGNNYYGLKEASAGYFGTTPSQLTLDEAAVLAGLPQAPSYYNPIDNPEGATARRNTVLTLMEEQHIINREQANAAKDRPLRLISGNDRT